MLKNELNNYFRFNPESLTLISTLKCTSSCNSCCFGCTPKSQAMFNIDQMYSIVDKVYKNNKTIKQIVLSGGESFLLGESLLEFIKYAKKHGYLTRCITNGYWAKEKKSTKIIVNRLIHAGLDEINFSTGGEHQVFVPFEIVADAAKLTTESGLLTVISIEGGDIDFSPESVSPSPAPLVFPF